MSIKIDEKSLVPVRAIVYAADGTTQITNTTAIEIPISQIMQVFNMRIAALDPATATVSQLITALRTPVA